MLSKVSVIILSAVFTTMLSVNSYAQWIDFEDLEAGTEFNYKPYVIENFELKASRYFDGGSQFFYDFILFSNLGDSNQGKSFLSIDTGSYGSAPGISLADQTNQAFDLNSIEVGKLYTTDGAFEISLTGLDSNGEVKVHEQFSIQGSLSKLILNKEYKGIHKLLINAVYVSELDQSVARFAVDNIDVSINSQNMDTSISTQDAVFTSIINFK